MTQAVAAYNGDTGLPASSVDLAADRTGMNRNHSAMFVLYGHQRIVKRIDDRDIPAADTVLIGLFPHQFVVFVSHYCAPDMNPPVFQIDIITIPVQCGDFGSAKGRDGQQSGNLNLLPLDGFQEGI